MIIVVIIIIIIRRRRRRRRRILKRKQAQQPISENFNFLTVCPKVVLNWILLRLKMDASSLNSTYVSFFCFYPTLYNIVLRIVSFRCDSRSLKRRTKPRGVLTNSILWTVYWIWPRLEKIATECSLIAKFIIVAASLSDWKLKRVPAVITKAALSLHRLVQLV